MQFKGSSQLNQFCLKIATLYLGYFLPDSCKPELFSRVTLIEKSCRGSDHRDLVTSERTTMDFSQHGPSCIQT